MQSFGRLAGVTAGLWGLCRKFAFLRPHPKIGCQKINGLRD